jgi:RHS repeat-associated protein
VLLSSSALAGQARAQAAASLLPVRAYFDDNGVDLATGSYNLSVGAISVGGPQGIAWVQGWQDTLSGVVREAVNSTTGNNEVGIYIGGLRNVFVQSGTSYTPKEGDGSRLSLSGATYTYISSDGNVAILQRIPPTSSSPLADGSAGYITSLTTAAGKTINYHYSTANIIVGQTPNGYVYRTFLRLQSIDDNLGYQIHATYQGATASTTSDIPAWWNRTGLVALDTSVDPCAVTANSCTTTAPWSRVSFAADGSVTDALGNTTSITKSTSQILIKFPGSVATNITVNLSGQMVTSVVRGGVTTTYSYADNTGVRTTTVTTGSLPARVYKFQISNSQILSLFDGLNTTQYTYNTLSQLTRITYPEGNYVNYARDPRGNTTETRLVSKTPGTPADIVSSASYDSTCSNTVTCNSPNTTTDARGGVTNYTYDPVHGGVTSVTAPAPTAGAVRPQTRYTYTQLGASGTASSTGTWMLTGMSACITTASCAGGADEVKTTVAYGHGLLLSSRTTGAGNGSVSASESFTYDAIGNAVTHTDPLSHLTRYVYDADRRPTEIVGPDPDGAGALKNRAQRNTYGPSGPVTLVEQGTANADGSGFGALQQVASAYDSANRLIQQSAIAGGSTYAVVQYGYDAAGRLQCTAQRMNSAVFGSLPSSPCTQGTAGSYGPDRITYNTYDNANQLTRITSGYGVSGLQRNETTYTYSANGKVKTLADAKNNLTTYVYDGFDRLSQTQYPSPTTAGSSNTADYEQLGYDAAGNVTSRRLRDGTSIGYGYDALNRMNSKTLPSGEHGVTYAYDNLGHPTTITGATTLSYGWDALGRMTSETQAYGSVAYQYDLGNRRTRLTWQDGTYLTYDYDNLDEMTAIHENGAAANLVAFSYDDLGERKTRTLANGTSTTYGYDAISRLTSLTLAGGTNANTATLSNYSPAGEIGARANSNDVFAWTQGANVNRGYTINGLNQFATIAGATQGYDGRGNLTSSGGTTYAYTSENLLKSVSTGQTLSYDPIGRLGEYDAPTATRFVYDGGMISEELNTSGGVLRRYVFGPAGDEPIVWYEGSTTATKRYLDQDERGSVTRITNADGSTYAVNSYDEYGIPGASNQGRFGYTGQAWLSEIGLAYYKARIYSPTLGRFMQTDPIGYGDGPNWYNYVGGNPVNAIDPSGMTCDNPKTWGESIACEAAAIAAALNEIVVNGHRPPATTITTPPPPQPPSISSPLGTSAGSSNAGSAPQNDCVKLTSDGKVCILRRDQKGKLQLTDEWKKIVCSNASAMQDAGSAINDTVGFPPVSAAGGAAGAAAAKRVGATAAGAARIGGAVGLYGWFVGLVAQTTTGQGWRPFGVQVVPKVDPSGCAS